MINRSGPGGIPAPVQSVQGAANPYSGTIINKRGPRAQPITYDNYGAWQAPPVDPNFVPTDNNSSGSLLRRMGPGDTGHITPQMIAAAQANPPQQVANAGGGNVAAGSFTTAGQGLGTFGQEQRRRLSRGPRTGLSVTPEMVRRAAARRLG